MADYTDLDPTLLRASVSDGTNLKPSLTTSSYAGGTPAAAADLKPSIAYADGTLKESIADADGVKANWLLVGSARPPVPAASVNSMAILSWQETSGTHAGTFTSGARRTVTLNTEDSDPDNIVSISGNQFTLQAGTYLIMVRRFAYKGDRTQFWLYNATDAADAERAQSTWTGAGSNQDQSSQLFGYVTIAGAKAFEIQHQCEATSATFGLGVASSLDTEVYCQIFIEKVA